MWNVTGTIPEIAQRSIISHLKGNCRFTFEGDYRLTGELVPFYGETLLCQLVLEAGCSLTSGRRRRQELPVPATFYFLYKAGVGDEILIPLTGGEGDLLLAKRWLGLSLQDDEQRLHYVRFYQAFARTKRPPEFRNVPRSLHELSFDKPVTEQRMWGIYGAMWRFLVNDKTLAVRVHFEPRGLHWRARQRAHLPMQFGNELHDVDLKIWDRDGHVTYNKTGLIYRDAALAEKGEGRPGTIGRPRYVRRSEGLLAFYRNFRTSINQALYLLATTLFLIATAIGLLFPLEIWGIVVVRPALEQAAALTGLGNWATWLMAACLYCIGYFVFTTLLILDLETLRDALLTWSTKFKGSALEEFLYAQIVKGRRVENGYRRGFLRRMRVAATWLVVWTAYIVCTFTSLQVSFRPWLADNAKMLGDVLQVFAEQAALYVPVVFYYVGRKSLEPERLVLVSFWVLVAFQLIMGLLVIRRIHRFWASTARANASN